MIDFESWFKAATRVIDAEELKYRFVGTIAEVESRTDFAFCSFIYEVWQSRWPPSYLATLSPETKAQSKLRLFPRLTQLWYVMLEVRSDCSVPIGIYLQTQCTREEYERKSISNPDDYDQIMIYPICPDQSQISGSVVERDACLSPRVKDRPDEKLGLANFDLINFWTQYCDTYHPFCQHDSPQVNSAMGGGPSEGHAHSRRKGATTLIDVHSRSLKVAGAEDRYIALSHVWGITLSNPRLLVKGSQDRKPTFLPSILLRTIEVAITVVKRLGER